MSFTATGTDVDGDTLTYAWAFGDGTTSSLQNPSHTYTSPGSYTSQVTVSDGKGGTASASVTITVTLPTYAVVYNANGATLGTVPAAQTKTHNVPLTLATNSGNLARSGYAFAGWNTAADGTGVSYAAGASYTANAPLTLYVRWTPNAVAWADGCEAYAAGSQLHGQGGWKGWDNQAAAGALAADTPTHAGARALAIAGASDRVHTFSGATTGKWTFRVWQYVPPSFSGTHVFILLDTYADNGAKHWASQIGFGGSTGNRVYSYGDGTGADLVKGRWVELRLEIDLDADLQSFYYDGKKLHTKSWSAAFGAGGARNIGAVALYAKGSSAVYYDDLSLTPGGQ